MTFTYDFFTQIILSFIQKVHPTIKKTHIERRIHRLTEGTHLDWATGEALAFGSLLHQGQGEVS